MPLTFTRIQPYVSPKIELSDGRQERVDLRVLPVIFRFASPKSLTSIPGNWWMSMSARSSAASTRRFAWQLGVVAALSCVLAAARSARTFHRPDAPPVTQYTHGADPTADRDR